MLVIGGAGLIGWHTVKIDPSPFAFGDKRGERYGQSY
jgi:hypothetical protein